tara:strand:- start:2067 stop:2375 length:309 start_codon:yes stop_codon:yes gene_type:complete
MAHTFLSLDMNLIPQTTKDNIPTFYSGLFSNDNSRMLIDGRNDKGELVHPMSVLLKWTQWSENPSEVVQSLLDDAIEYTAQEFTTLKADVNSIWYDEPEALT